MIAKLGSRRVRILTGTALIAAITLAVIAYAPPARPPHDFSGQYDFPGLFGTDALGGFPATVSAAQAFHDHGIVPPPHIRDLRYAANSTGYDGPDLYPFEATFAIPCTETSRFVKDSHLQYAGTAPLLTASPPQDVDVGSFAQEQGWDPADPLARWYYNTQTYQGIPVSLDYLELMITGRRLGLGPAWLGHEPKPCMREAVLPQMHVRCDLGLDLDGLGQPRIAVTGQCPGLSVPAARLAAGKCRQVRSSGYGCAVWRGHRVLLRSFTLRPPSWTSKMK